MDAPAGGRAPGDPAAEAAEPADTGDADLVVAVLHRVGPCSVQDLSTVPELDAWSSVRLERAVTRAWNGGLVFIDRNDDLVAL